MEEFGFPVEDDAAESQEGRYEQENHHQKGHKETRSLPWWVAIVLQRWEHGCGGQGR